MGVYKEIQILETDIFNALEAAYKAIAIRDRTNAKMYIGTVEILNEEYKNITKVDFVKESDILKLYERFWEKCNA